MDDLDSREPTPSETPTPSASAHVSELAAQVRNMAGTLQALCARVEQVLKLAADERAAAADERKELMATARAMQQVVSESDQQIEKLGDATMALAQAVEVLEELAAQAQQS